MTANAAAGRVNLLDLDIAKMRDFFRAHGEASYRALQVSKWIHQHGVADFEQMTDLSKDLRAKLPQIAYVGAPKVALCQRSTDGTRKWLLEVADAATASRNTPAVGNKVEMVFIPEQGRGTLCVSSQIGCSLYCSFCSTARQGFSRNLSVAEIVGQLYVAREQLLKEGSPAKITNVVLMGMGEPLLNYRNVIDAVNMMMDDNLYGLSKRRVTISTSGVVPAMARMIKDTQAALAVSLHAPFDALRDELVPINKKHPLQDLLAQCDAWVAAGHKRHVTYEYVMLQAVNDSKTHAHALGKLLAQRAAKVNLIPFNSFAGAGYQSSTEARIKEFKRILNSYGIFTFPRKTRGDDIDAACGQLVGKVQDRSARHLQFITPRFGEKSR